MNAPIGWFSDTTLGIDCKACEVACKQWNQWPDDGFELTDMSHDNTAALGASTWRHVAFAERPIGTDAQLGGSIAWKMRFARLEDDVRRLQALRARGVPRGLSTGAITCTDLYRPRPDLHPAGYDRPSAASS